MSELNVQLNSVREMKSLCRHVNVSLIVSLIPRVIPLRDICFMERRSDTDAKSICLVWQSYETHYDHLESDSDNKKKTAERERHWIRISNPTFHILRGTGILACARSRVSAAVYIGHFIRGEISPITHLSDMWLLKKYLSVPIRHSIRTSVSRITF